MVMNRLLFIVILFLSVVDIIAQQSEYFNDTNVFNRELILNIEAVSFFNNYEYSNRYVNGYTLPGYFINPKIALALSKNTTINLGINYLNYFVNML